jgi:Lon protease-like protein
VRIRVNEWLPDDPYPQAMVEEEPPVADLVDEPSLLEAAVLRVRRARALLSEHGQAAPLPPDVRFDGGGDHEVAAWQVCAAAPVSAYDSQKLLAAERTTVRLRLLVELMEDLELVLHRMLTSE